jgi:DNA-binding IclR family transcriptional regulator
MDHSAPAALRAIRVINLLAAHPARSFTLSELAQRLDINRASALRVLRQLTAAGFLERHPRHLTYSLGMTLVAIGQAAAVRHPAVRAAQREMESFADEFGVQCNAVVVDDAGSLVVAEAGHGALTVGTRLPRMPAIGLVHWAFANAAERREFVASASLGARRTSFLDVALDTIRTRGFAIALRGPARDRMSELLAVLVERPDDPKALGAMRALWKDAEDGELQLIEFEPKRNYRVAHIAAPVFGADGEVLLEVVARRLPEGLSGRRIAELAERLRGACGVATRAVRGRVPERAARRPLTKRRARA